MDEAAGLLMNRTGATRAEPAGKHASSPRGPLVRVTVLGHESLETCTPGG